MIIGITSHYLFADSEELGPVGAGDVRPETHGRVLPRAPAAAHREDGAVLALAARRRAGGPTGEVGGRRLRLLDACNKGRCYINLGEC